MGIIFLTCSLPAQPHYVSTKRSDAPFKTVHNIQNEGTVLEGENLLPRDVNLTDLLQRLPLVRGQRNYDFQLSFIGGFRRLCGPNYPHQTSRTSFLAGYRCPLAHRSCHRHLHPPGLEPLHQVKHH